MKTSRWLPALLALLVQGRAWFQTLAFAGRVAAPLAVRICRWIGFGTAIAGPAHAMSAASASVAGVVVYNGPTPAGDPTNHVFGKVGTPFKIRIVVDNPGTDHDSDLFDCRPVPPGLQIDTAVGAKGFLLGIPSRAGSYPVTVFAGNARFDGGLVSMPLLIDIAPNGIPPAISSGPVPVEVAAGGDAAFVVMATGDEPLLYQWWVGELPVPTATLPTLALGKVPLTAAGDYRVVVSNPAGSVTSAPAALVVSPFDVPIRLERTLYESNQFGFDIEGPRIGTYLLWKSHDATGWFPIATQRVTTGSWYFGTNCALATGFFRATATP